MIELRWLMIDVEEGEKVLQYRQAHDIVDYSRKTKDGTFLKTTEITEWTTVPIVDRFNNENIR